MPSKILKFISYVFSAIWIVIIFTEYWRTDPAVGKAIVHFQYTELLAVLAIIGGGAYLFFQKYKPDKSFTFNGLAVFLAFLCLDIIVILFFYGKVGGLDLTISALFTQLGTLSLVTLSVALIYLFVRTIGMLFLKVFPVRLSGSDRPLIEVGIGIMLVVSLMFFLGLFGTLNAFVLLPILILLISIYWRFMLKVIKDTFVKKIDISPDLNVIGILSFLLTGLFITLNFIQILRPIPLGSDALNVYVNVPVVLSQTQELVSGYQPYNWSLFMSLGLIIFDKMEVVLALSFFGGFLSMIGLYQLSRKWLSVNYSALVVLLFYCAPMVNFLSYMDMKIDMGLMFYTAIILLIYYNWQDSEPLPTNSELPDGPGLDSTRRFFKKIIPSYLSDNRLLILMGLLTGFAVGIKLTVLFFFLAFITSLWYLKGGKVGFLAAFFLCFLAVLVGGLDNQPGLRQFHMNIPLVTGVLLIGGLGSLVFLFIRKREQLQSLMTYSLVLGSFFLLPIIPWVGKNYCETGQVNMTALVNGKKDAPVIEIDRSQKKNRKNRKRNAENRENVIPGIYDMPERLGRAERRRNKDVNSSVSEDLHRFMGYEIMPIRYLSLPYDVFIKPNVTASFTDVGFILLLLIPIVFLFSRKRETDWISIISRFFFMIFSLMILMLAISGAYMNNNKITSPESAIEYLKTDNFTGLVGSFSQYMHHVSLELYTPIHHLISGVYLEKDPITYSILLVAFLFLSSLVWSRVRGQSLRTKSTLAFLTMYFCLWWFLGSGVAWYGILIFSFAYIFLFFGIDTGSKVEDLKPSKELIAKKYLILSASTLWVFMAFTQRMASYNPINDDTSKFALLPSVVEYQAGTIEKNILIDYHFPSVRHFTDIINKDRGTLVYRVGTAFNFFIEDNERRVLSDNFLDLFEKLVWFYDSKEEIVETLKSEGFKYIVIDLNLPTYDKTLGKTLTRKYNQLMNTLYENPNAELMATDRKVRLANGEEIFAVYEDEGNISFQGSFALFKIK